MSNQEQQSAARIERPYRRIAIHEAGHSLAYWWNGQFIHQVAARTKSEIRTGPIIDRRGQSSNAAGCVDATNFIPGPGAMLMCGMQLPPERRDEVERDLLHAYSGPVAEAIYCHTRLEVVLYGGAYGDLLKARELLELLPLPHENRIEINNQAIRRCRFLVRHYGLAICKVADLLQSRGTVDGEELEDLLISTTGESPQCCGNSLTDLDK
ncbi:hypothetical protein D3C78_635560 [compost metagenome]